MSTRILLSGASGAMGRQVEALAAADPDWEIVGRAGREAFFDDDAAGDVVVDFSRPALLARSLEFAAARGIPVVTGTTGLESNDEDRLRNAATHIAVCHAANFSLGVFVLGRLAREAAALLGMDWDLEIAEFHHRRKVDAPSGTALALGRALAKVRGLDHDQAAVFDRHGTDRARRPGEIGYSAVRGGDVPGEHTVFLLGDGERLELTHRAGDRSIFARGALRAARWIVGQPSGWYSLQDVLGNAPARIDSNPP